jgi:hypothetical protein
MRRSRGSLARQGAGVGRARAGRLAALGPLASLSGRVSSYTTIPAPRQTSPLRVLAAVACVAVIAASIAVTVLAVKLIGMTSDVNRAVDDASTSARRLDRRTRDLTPAIRELRDAARQLQSANPLPGP